MGVIRELQQESDDGVHPLYFSFLAFFFDSLVLPLILVNEPSGIASFQVCGDQRNESA